MHAAPAARAARVWQFTLHWGTLRFLSSAGSSKIKIRTSSCSKCSGFARSNHTLCPQPSSYVYLGISTRVLGYSTYSGVCVHTHSSTVQGGVANASKHNNNNLIPAWLLFSNLFSKAVRSLHCGTSTFSQGDTRTRALFLGHCTYFFFSTRF